MKLVLTQPSPWPVHWLADGAPPVSDEPSIVIGPLEAARNGLVPQIEAAISFERPPFTVAEIVRHSEVHSLLRWKVEMVESRIIVGAKVLERRLTYLYFPLEWCGPVTFRAQPEQFATDVERALVTLAGARPDWTDGAGIVALCDLFR
jgi:hypothetical protein